MAVKTITERDRRNARKRIAKNIPLLILLPTKFAVDLQWLGGIWMLQIFPGVICGLYTRWPRFRPAHRLGRRHGPG